MTILPTKRSSTSAEDSNENTQNNNSERSRNATNNDASKTGTRRQFCGTPESSDHGLRKRYKDVPTAPRRKQQRERKGKRLEQTAEDPLDVIKTSLAESPVADETVSTTSVHENAENDDATGFNSEDEYNTPLSTINHLTDGEWTSRDNLFARCLGELGYEIKQMNEDGACLFRAIADQIFGDQELHFMVRTSCMDYVVKNKDFFAPYMTEDFDKYVARKKQWNVHGNHLEIQAMSEMYNRTIELYCYQIEPINIFSGPRINADEPIRLSYHRMCHYNSISNPNKPSVGVGLGLPSYHTIDLNRRRMVDAVRASEELLIEQTMLEDKIKATDWEATNETLEEEVARESYIQYYRDVEKRIKPQGAGSSARHAASSSSTITSAHASSPRAASSRRGSTSPKGAMSPKGGSSPKGNTAIVSLRSSPRSAGSSTSQNEFAINSNVPLGAIDTAFDFSVSSSGQSPTNSQNMYNFENRLKIGEFSSKGKGSRGENSSEVPNLEAACNSGSVISNRDMLSDVEEDWLDGIMAQVLAESRKTYLDDLKRNSKKLGSPGPSTSR